MVDLAIPRDIEPETGELSDIYLYSLDDFQEIIDKNLNIKEKAATDAEEIVSFYASQYKSQEAISDKLRILRDFRNANNLIKEEEILKAITNLEKGDEPKEVIIQLGNQLTNKIMHEPTIRIKNALDCNNQRLIEAAVELYNLRKNDE
jgi:glutamyl-tRNA reductase